jgi:alpha/beta superfamily hydrolase
MRWPHCALCGAALRLGVGVGAAVGDAAAADAEAAGSGDASEAGRGTAQAAVVTRSSATPAALTRISEAYTTASRPGSRDTALVREEAQRIDARLEGTLRVPDGQARAIVVIAHPLPTHGGEMRNPLVAGIARACAERGWYALRFNFRGVGKSAGTWSGGRDEAEDVGAAVEHARGVAPGLPLGVVGYSFGALMALRWLSGGGRTDALVLVGLPLRSVSGKENDIAPVPDGTVIAAAERDQFGTAAELRARYPRADLIEVKGADHFFVGQRDELQRHVTDALARRLG